MIERHFINAKVAVLNPVHNLLGLVCALVIILSWAIINLESINLLDISGCIRIL